MALTCRYNGSRRFREDGSFADDHKFGICDDEILDETGNMIETLEEGNLTFTMSMAILNKPRDQGR